MPRRETLKHYLGSTGASCGASSRLSALQSQVLTVLRARCAPDLCTYSSKSPSPLQLVLGWARPLLCCATGPHRPRINKT